MIRGFVAICFLVVLTVSMMAQQPAWNVTLAPNSTARSNLSVVNQCRNPHNFELQRENVPFLTIGQNQVQVSGGTTVEVPVRFDTAGLATGTYQGQVLVICLTCRSEPTCSQDRSVLPVIVNVSAPPQPIATPKPTPKPSPSPTGVQFSGPPRLSAPTGQQNTPGQTIAAFEQLVGGGCFDLLSDCDKLRQSSAEAEAAANSAQNTADDSRRAADDAEAKAAAADAAAKKAADAAKPANSSGSITSDGETFSDADNAWLDAKKKKLFDDWQAGRISAEEQQAQRAALSGPDALKKAREERLANEAKLKKEAEAAKAAADAARTAADKEKADAAAAQKAADAEKAAAAAALEAYKKCLKAAEEECARIAAEKKKKDDAAAAAAAIQAANDKKKKEDLARAAAQQAEIDYLLDNFKRLGLITHLPTTNIPDPLDPAFDALQKLTGESIRNFLQSVAGQVGGGPIDPSLITGLGEAYKAMSALFSLRTKAGLERVHRLLTTKIINPKTGKVYTDDQAWNKIKRMEDLMDKIKARLGK